MGLMGVGASGKVNYGADKRRERKPGKKGSGPDEDEPLEQLMCPSCRTSYAFGDICPDCDVELMGASLIEGSRPDKTNWIARLLAIAIWLLILGGGASAAAWWAGLLDPWLTP
jgi:hypothetical protein